VEGPAREVWGIVKELGKGFGEGLVIYLLHLGRKEGGAEAQHKAHRCGQGGKLLGGTSGIVGVDLRGWMC